MLVPIPDVGKESHGRVTRYFCFRFDVDTHRCIRRGVPNLMALGARIDVPFSFFVNMGRAISRARLASPRRGTPGPVHTEVAAKLPARAKLGAWDTLIAVALNPPVGAGSPHVLTDAIEAGHEVGLHGGANHAVWQAEAHRWPHHRVRAEVTGGLRAFEQATGQAPAGFASPGWNSPDPLPPILEQLGFRYMADLHGPETGRAPGSGKGAGDGGRRGGDRAVQLAPGTQRLSTVRTVITAEPGGVAYLENLRARGWDKSAIRADFQERLQRAGRLAVVYDHPYFAGVRELELVGDLVQLARDAGFRPVRLMDAVSALSNVPE